MKNIRLIFFSVIYLISIFSASADKNPGRDSKKTGNSQNSSRDVTAGCVPGATSSELDINNVRALIHTGGDMWWDLIGNPAYEIPKGSNKTSLFAGALWIGGVDAAQQLKIAAQRFRVVGVDYWPGPLIVSGTDQADVSPEVCIQYDKHFKITRHEVEKFRAWYNADEQTQEEEFPGYSVPDIITNWPAHGDLGNGYSYYLAPFFDANADDNYNPEDGDYPWYDLDDDLPCPSDVTVLKGDQTLWWVFNDNGNIHTESGGDAIGLEIRAQAFAFSTNNELNDMTFYNYRIINRSISALYDTYFGIWTDADLGYAYDDYAGCDVIRGLGYIYNGEAVDGSGQYNAYGGPDPPPPAVGIDFFKGPFQDADGLDNPSSFDPVTGELMCDGNIMNGNINGLNFGDGIVDNERWGMRRYIYFNNIGGGFNPATTDPADAIDYYNYLKGIWKDGTKLLYGGTGHTSGTSSTTEADYMFPYDSDPCGWGTGGVPQAEFWYEEGEGNQPYDRRFVQSAGPFTMEPGEINDITFGVVWARAFNGTPFSSVLEMQRADDVAQSYFDNCFEIINGPHAPEISIIELDKKLIFHIWNKPASNNYLEQYDQTDPVIVCPAGISDCDKTYNFQGYQIFQVTDTNVTLADLHDPDKARMVFQCDIQDDIDQIVNYYWLQELNANMPVLEADGTNEGISHSFTISEDIFSANEQLSNNAIYYYLAIAYAHNDFLHYSQSDPTTFYGQKKPYLPSSKGVNGELKIWSGTPHWIPDSTIYGDFGEGPRITQMEGHGNGDNILDLTQETIDEIMSGEPWIAYQLTYKKGLAPIQVKVIDPLNIPDDDYTIKFDSVNYTTQKGNIKEAKWYIYNTSGDTIFSDEWISKYDGSEYINICNEQLIPEWGFSVTIAQSDYPGRERENGGFLYASMEFDDPSHPWLEFFPDAEGATPQNWIRAGTFEDPNNPHWNDNKTIGFIDPDEIYENVLNGTWAPYTLGSPHKYGVSYDEGFVLISYKKQRLPSVDLVITADKSRWTRCPVVEMCENDTDYTDPDDPVVIPGLSGVWKFDLRNAPSVDKDGRNQYDANCNTEEATMNGTQVYTQEDYDNDIIDDQSIIGISYTMGWFPGYAIDVETGERLNIMFGEDSWFSDENGSDMLWNPTGNIYSDLYIATNGLAGDVYFGGKHCIYIMGHNNIQYPMTRYDYGAYIYEQMKYYTHSSADKKKQNVYRNAAWTSIPLANPGYNLLATDLVIKLRIANPYYVGILDLEVPDPQNENKPMYTFNTSEIATEIADPVAEFNNDLDLSDPYPNPACNYAVIKFRLPENATCGTLSIYDIKGRLINKQDVEKTQNCVFISLNKYSPGIYLYNLKTNTGESKTKKLLLVR